MTGDTDRLRPVRLVIDGAEDVGPVTRRKDGGDGPDLRPVEFSDDALGAALSAELGPDWRSSPDGQWRRWDGQVWAEDGTGAIFHRSRLVCRAVANSCEALQVARKVSSKQAAYAAVVFAAKDPRHATALEAFDADPWLLNTPGGIVDTRSGAVLVHTRDALMTKITWAAPDGDCPTWRRFLQEATGSDRELQRFLQRVAGYCLTGDTSEHAIFFLYGPGGTGKSLYINTQAEALGGYATTAAMDLFTVATGERHPADLAALHGPRLVTASETEEGRRWDEAKLKAITGGDPITARFMRGNPFTFRPRFKLLMAGNYRPAMRSADDAMRRRFHIIPFLHKPEKLDRSLPEKLRGELGGILTWAIEGAVEWQKIGLAPPAAVVEATNEYFANEDVVGKWIAERCMLGGQYTATTDDLYRDYKSWASLAGEFVLSKRRLAQRLRQRGLEAWMHPATRCRGYQGIALLVSPGELPLGGLAGGGGAGKWDDPHGAPIQPTSSTDDGRPRAKRAQGPV